jgi:hypothetical protein
MDCKHAATTIKFQQFVFVLIFPYVVNNLSIATNLSEHSMEK